ncbi:MAG: hypothetical protein NTX16_11425 [Actinobacteria bacterium]|nr:hypothetical protein [Actinomycetota bacterium]
MAQSAPSKPDLTAHENSIRLEPAEIVSELRSRLGARLVAYLAGVSETRAVHEWAAGERQIRQSDALDRLRLAYQVVQLIGSRDDDAVIQAWFQGLNPKLDDRSPARLLRDGRLHEVGPGILAAARAFAAIG